MSDEFDYKNFKNIEDFLKTLESSKYYHSLYLKAVNHPIRRKILKIINEINPISKKQLFEKLNKKENLENNSFFTYHIEFLIKALCIKKYVKNNKIYYEITQSGKIIEFLDSNN
ncbi:MAG: hypothetical protein ACTSPD_16540 [Promethearchaeota archaeon]